MLPPGREGGRLWLKKENCLFGCVFCCRRFALVLLWSGSLCANALLDSHGGPKAKEILLQTGEEIRSANQLLFEKKTYQIIYDYSIAFLDSAIAFDFLPTYDIDGLWGLIPAFAPRYANRKDLVFL